VTTYLISEPAETDLVEIWDYIAPHNLNAADRLIEKFFEAFQKLADLPKIGHSRPDLTHRVVRFWPVGHYLVIYKSEVSPIEIVRVLSGFRDIITMLET